MTLAGSHEFQFRLSHMSGDDGHMQLASGRRNQFLCDVRHWPTEFLLKLTPRLLDLLRIATAVYVADRISLRDRTHEDYGWSRSLSMRIEVFDCEFWSSREVMDCLHRCVEFVSGDFWNIAFAPNPSRFDLGLLPIRSAWRPLSGTPVVCLYSGGLDSAAGLVRSMNRHDSRDIVPLLVRHSGQGRLVQDQLAGINIAMNAHLRPLVLVPFWMRSPKKLGCSEEISQRTRSFLFCSAAGVLASVIQARTIEMMEGGIGSINVPLMAGMFGSKATRSSHPTFLRRFSELLRLITNRDLAVELPHQFLTKAELTQSLIDAGLGELALNTVSCVHYPLRNKTAKQCGTCPACIFRRQAMLTSGIDESGVTYHHDLFSRDSAEIPDQKLTDLKAFLMQIDKLSSLEYSDQLPSCVVRHLRATEVIANENVPAKLVDLYRRYRHEWLHLVDIGQRRGWKWTRMMEPISAGS